MNQPKNQTYLERCPRCNSTDLIEHYNPFTEACDVECAICGFSWSEETEPVGEYDE